MKLLRLFIPGSFEDAQLYMGHLVAVDSEGDLRLAEIERVAEQLEHRYPSWQGVLTFAFARNDWLGSAVLAALVRNSALAVALNDAVDEVGETTLTLEASDVKMSGVAGFEQTADLILDTEFYAARLYLGTTSGVFDYDIDWQRGAVDASHKRHDARCVAVTAEYGTVNASCESEGLFTAYDEFGWRVDSANRRRELAQTAPRSIRAAWYGTDLVNYEGQVHAELLRSVVERVRPDSATPWPRQRKVVVTEFEAPTGELDDLVEELSKERKVPRDDVQFVWNSSRAFFINTHTHGFFTAYRRDDPDKKISITRHGETDGRVIAVHRFARGWVIETDFRAYLWAGGTLHELVEEEPLSVRTFSGSKRYRRLIAVTGESGIHLISVIDRF